MPGPNVVEPAAAAHRGTLVQLRDHCLHHMSAASGAWVAVNSFMTAYHLFKAMPIVAGENEAIVVCLLEFVLLIAEFFHALGPFKHSSPHLHVDTGWVMLLHRILVVVVLFFECFVHAVVGTIKKKTITIKNATGHALPEIAPSFMGIFFHIISSLFTTWMSLRATIHVFQAVRKTHLEDVSKQLRERMYKCRPGWSTNYGMQVPTSLGNFRRKHAIDLTGGPVSGWQADYGLAVSPWDGDARRRAATDAWNENHREKLVAYQEALRDNGYLADYGSSVNQENGERRRREAEARVGSYDTFMISSSCASGRAKRVDVSDVVIESSRRIVEETLREIAEMEEEQQEEGGTSLFDQDDQEDDQDVYYSAVENQYKQD